MTILVLGGAGYIGSHTVYALLKAGYDVVVADNLSSGHIQAIPPEARFYKMDARDLSAFGKVMAKERDNGIEGIIDFAAYSQVAESQRRPLKYYNNNVVAIHKLLQTMVNFDIDKVVFSSSAAVYGQPEQMPITENTPTAPTNCYGETKLAAERLLYWASQAIGIRYVSLRYFNACGAHPAGHIGEAHDPETHLLPLVLQTAAGQRDKVTIFGDDYPTPDGTCIRDYVHVCDLAQAHVCAIEYLIKGGKSNIFNLGSGAGFSVRQIIDAAQRITGQPIPTEIAKRRSGDPAQLLASSTKAKRTLGWRPEFNQLTDIISTAWAWHTSHPNGFEGESSVIDNMAALIEAEKIAKEKLAAERAAEEERIKAEKAARKAANIARHEETMRLAKEAKQAKKAAQQAKQAKQKK